jgi:hypothetical protein
MSGVRMKIAIKTALYNRISCCIEFATGVPGKETTDITPDGPVDSTDVTPRHQSGVWDCCEEGELNVSAHSFLVSTVFFSETSFQK